MVLICTGQVGVILLFFINKLRDKVTSFKVIRRVHLKNKRKPKIRALPTGGRAEPWGDQRWILRASSKWKKSKPRAQGGESTCPGLHSEWEGTKSHKS